MSDKKGCYLSIISVCSVIVSIIVCASTVWYQFAQVALEKQKFEQGIQDTYFNKRMDFIYDLYQTVLDFGDKYSMNGGKENHDVFLRTSYNFEVLKAQALILFPDKYYDICKKLDQSLASYINIHDVNMAKDTKCDDDCRISVYVKEKRNIFYDIDLITKIIAPYIQISKGDKNEL